MSAGHCVSGTGSSFVSGTGRLTVHAPASAAPPPGPAPVNAPPSADPVVQPEPTSAVNDNPRMPLVWTRSAGLLDQARVARPAVDGAVVGAWDANNGTRFLRGGTGGAEVVYNAGRDAPETPDHSSSPAGARCLYVPRDPAPTPCNATVYVAFRLGAATFPGIHHLLATTVSLPLRSTQGGWSLGCVHGGANGVVHPTVSVDAPFLRVTGATTPLSPGVGYVLTAVYTDTKLGLFCDGLLLGEAVRSGAPLPPVRPPQDLILGGIGSGDGQGTGNVVYGGDDVVYAVEFHKHEHSATTVQTRVAALRAAAGFE